MRLLPTTWRQVLLHRSRHSVVRKGSKLQDWAMPPCNSLIDSVPTQLGLLTALTHLCATALSQPL